MSVVISIAQVLVLVALAPLLSGFSRWMRAKMHTRKGPSILQDYYDIAKLFKRQDLRTKHSSFVHGLMPVVFLGVMLVLAAGLPLFAQRSPMPLLADIVLIVYLLALVRFFFALASLDNADGYAGVGGMRELIVGILVEPGMMLALFVLAVSMGTTNLGVMSSMIAAGDVAAPLSVLFAGVALAYSCYIEMGKLPYDLAEAEQEIQEGPLQEYSGPSLALLRVAMPLKQVLVAGLFVAVFMPFGAAADVSVLAGLGGALAFVVKIFAVFFVCALLENAVSRVRYKYAGRQIWVTLGISVLALAFGLIGI